MVQVSNGSANLYQIRRLYSPIVRRDGGRVSLRTVQLLPRTGQAKFRLKLGKFGEIFLCAPYVWEPTVQLPVARFCSDLFQIS